MDGHLEHSGHQVGTAWPMLVSSVVFMDPYSLVCQPRKQFGKIAHLFFYSSFMLCSLNELSEEKDILSSIIGIAGTAGKLHILIMLHHGYKVRAMF